MIPQVTPKHVEALVAAYGPIDVSNADLVALGLNKILLLQVQKERFYRCCTCRQLITRQAGCLCNPSARHG